ncbi:MAG: hypothetical protein M3040_15425 [Bacteroidota bacterium]|nr:hypothetical protein [Bacteroidota bacterium]
MKSNTIQKKMPVSALFTSIGVTALLVILASCSSHKKMMNDTNMKMMKNNDLISMHENNSTVADYIKYVDANNKMVPDHEYIKNALVKLSDATNAMAGAIGYTVMGDLNMAKDDANKITKNANESTHAANIRKSADILSSALQHMQQAKYPSLSTAGSELVSASAAIKPSVLTDNQKAEIVDFFRRSAYLLEKMN